MWSKIVGQLKPQPFSAIFGVSAPPPATTPSLKHDKPYGRRSSVGSAKDPRITVARRKTSLLYGVGGVSDRNKSDNQSPRKIIPPEQQKELNSLFLQWQNSFDEKDRIFFLTATSRKYFEIFFEHSEMLGESLDDLEIFTDAITRYLIDSIRKALSSTNKLQASQEILQTLADEKKLFFIIKTINLLCNGPEFIFEIMSAHSLPALLIEIFQCFVEVSSQADYPQMNRGDENHTQKMAPSEVIADILADILVNFVSYSITLTQMLEQDLLYSLITMVITEQPCPGINLWIERVLEVIVELFACATQEVVTYFVNKDIMGTLMKLLKKSIDMEGNKFIDSGQLIYTGSLLIELIQGALHVSPIFIESFINMNGYETLFYLLIFPPFDKHHATSKDTLITMVEDLVFAGADELKPVASQGTPYQHSDFQLPTENEDDVDTLFRNEKAFQILISVLLYPDTSFYPFSSDFKISDSIKIPDIFFQKIVVAIAEILKSNQSNYFLIEALNVLPTIIEQLDRFSPKVQRSILDLLVFVMVDLNYVPFRELVVLLLHFQGQSLKHTTAIVCETVTSLLQSSSKFKEVFREIGLLNMLCSLLQDLTTTLQEKFGNTHFVRRISISQLSDALDNQQKESSKIKSRFGPEVIDNFHLISECLVELLKNNKANLSLFGSTYKGNLFDLLHYDETRDGALSIFETLVVEGYVLSNNTDPQTPMSRIAASSSSCIEHSFQFGRLIEIVQSLPRFDLKMKRHILLSMKRILVSCPDMKDVFRESGGFVCLVSLLVGLEDIFKLLTNVNSTEQNSSASQSFEIDELPSKSQAIDTLKAIFLIFAEAMSNHDSNRRFFDSSIGYMSVKDAICLTDILSSTGSPEHLFGILFSFAIENEFVTEVFIDDISDTENISTNNITTNNITTNNISTNNISTTNLSTTNLSMNNKAESSTIIKMFGNLTDEIRNPSIIPTIMDLQLYVNHDPKLVLKIYEALLALSFANRRNQVMMNKSGVLEIVLRRLFPASTDERKKINPQEKQFLTRLAQRLIEMGVSTTEIRFLFEQFENGNQQPEDIDINVDGTLMTVMDMVLFGVQRSRWPRFVQFDMCQFGYSCLEMNNLSDRQFPPANGGYTFMTWLDIENFDSDIDLTLLGLSDEENRCYLHIYIEAQTHRLIAQSSPKQGARFDSFEFRTGCWYHIALVHNKPRIGSPSSVSLFVDGRFVEVVKCPYLGQPAPNKAIRSYIGTPIDVARKIGKGYTKLVWDLGPCYFFEDDLDGDIISVYYHLGPRYSSNFQDSLGQFQTYQTSTLLNMRVEALSRQRKDSNIELDHLAMVNAIRGNNSQTLPEDKIIFAFNASNVLVCGQNTSILGAGLSEGTSQALTLGTVNTKVILNAAVPKVERALRVPHGLAYLKGDPVTAVPYGMDDSIWKIGGSAVVLRMIERAETATDLYKTVCTLIELIRFSWRNSEDMERIHGYEILAYLLKQKHGLLTMELLNLLLVFVGLNPLSHNDSVIINPLAYRFLILDFDLWRHSHESVQRAHLHQFSIFIQLSQHHHFNAKRLSKMHVVKKMLVALKTNIYPKELLTDFIATLKIVVKYNFTTEVIRSIATFLVSTLNKTSPARRLTRKESPLKTGMTVTFSHENVGKLSPKTIVTDVRNVPVETMAKHIGVMVMEMLTEIVCDKLNPFYVNKFATTITNKWPLLFFGEDSNAFWVVCAARILSRLFHSQGTNYINKFRTSSEGFTVMQKLLPQWWYLTQLQQTLFTMLFGVDICDVPIDAPFDLFSLLTLFRAKDDTTRIVVPDVMSIILLMMKEGINTIVQLSYDVEKDFSAKGKTQDDAMIQRGRPSSKHQRQRSRSLTRDLETFNENDDKPTKETLSKLSHVEQTFIHFLTDMHNNSTEFSDLCYKSEIMDVFIEILFPIVCACDEVSIETELYSKEFGLSFDADSTFEKLLSNNGVSGILPVLNTFLRHSKSQHFFDEEHGEEMKSFSSNPIIITTEPFQNSPSVSPTQSDLEDESDSVFVGIKLPERKEKKPEYEEHKNTTVESLLEFIVSICVNSILDPKTKQLAGLDIVLRSFPPSFLEHQIQLESYILLHVLGSLKSTLQLDMNLLNDHRIVANVARFSQMATDTIYQGWFLDGCNQMYDFITIVLEGIQRNDEPTGKRANDQWINILYRSLDRIILFKLSEIDQTSTKASVIIEILEKLIYHQKVIFSPFNTDLDFLKCLCYHLYKFLLYDHQEVKTNSTSIWKLLMLQKPIEMSGILKTRVKGIEYKELVEGFAKLLEMDLNSFLEWIDSRKIQLDALFQENISRVWESLVIAEIKNCKESLKNFHSKRMNKLKKLYKKASMEQDFFNQYRIKTNQWSRHIQEIETGRYYKSIQDNIDHYNYVRDEWAKTSTDLFRERALWGSKTVDTEAKWRLDFTEGRCRMRKKLERNEDPRLYSYRPKSCKYENIAKEENPQSSPITKSSSSLEIPGHRLKKLSDRQMTLTPSSPVNANETENSYDVDSVGNSQYTESQAEIDDENAFEEDKNRKVLRSLEHGDAVLDIYNISRIIGLDACEGLLLLCKQNLYLIDSYFQTSDGEIVDIWDAPTKERDQYLQMLASHAGYANNTPVPTKENKHKSRKWAFEDIKEVHKRKFLFRDVALEIFFADGRNYLITFFLKERDIAYNKLVARATFSISGSESVIGTSNTLDSKAPVTPLTIGPSTGLRFNLPSFFANSSLVELTMRWEKREISNFQYLMHLNTLAGRSYNDLTQYPVFPWILADYTSEELDLNKPETFRDLSTPMGAQTPERRKEFRIRYRSFDPTANATTPAFHYGTHYSSAMIVCSYLIRLEPFTQQYLKLQGGHFDHADRLFHSINKAWLSATRDNMSDVKELIPEFFYLPEFLENTNKFNFGVKQGTGEVIDSVILPPWANGDPKIFINKHRQALESDYVSAHLNEWIDLIFGYKQQGPAAVEAINVFHHLSYEGAIDLDAITDPVERSATTGIIYNFGQTPRQLFSKPHPPRSVEISEPNNFKFHENLEYLLQSMQPTLDIRLQVHDIHLMGDRLLAVSTQKILVPPNYTHYVEWGYSDNSLRLHNLDTRKLVGLYENLHLQTVSCACFADGRSFITGGTDAVICIWRLKWKTKSPEFRFMECLRGHSSKINCVAVSRSYSIIVSGSDDTTCIVWDLNRMKYVRQLQGHETGVKFVAINDITGDIATCSGSVIRIWSVNGDLIVTKNTAQGLDPVLCCVFYEGRQNEWFEKDIILTGHKKGVIKIWHKSLDDTEKKVKWDLELRHQLKHENRLSSTFAADIVSIFISGVQKVVYSGDSTGKIWSWVLPDIKIESHWMSDGLSDVCLKCGVKFAVLERKIHCKTCGGIFCSSCTQTGLDRSSRYCEYCWAKIEPLLSL